MVNSQARMLVPGSKLSSLAHALSTVSCTRSSATEGLRDRLSAKARSSGTNPTSSSRVAADVATASAIVAILRFQPVDKIPQGRRQLLVDGGLVELAQVVGNLPVYVRAPIGIVAGAVGLLRVLFGHLSAFGCPEFFVTVREQTARHGVLFHAFVPYRENCENRRETGCMSKTGPAARPTRSRRPCPICAGTPARFPAARAPGTATPPGRWRRSSRSAPRSTRSCRHASPCSAPFTGSGPAPARR